MSIQMLHKQSTDTQLCPHHRQGWAVTQGWIKPPGLTTHSQNKHLNTLVLSSFNTSSITSYILFPDETALSYRKIANFYTLDLSLT